MNLSDPALGDAALRHLQALLRLDTTNPPGEETLAADYLAGVLGEAGLEPFLCGRTPRRRCLVARLSGDGSAGPLLLSAHLDVVPADGARWRHPPFGGVIEGGYLWGRGAIDMKHMAAMAAVVMARLRQEGRPLRRDLIFAAVADEEAGCDEGSRYLVAEHAERVRAEYALTEVGGFTLHLGGRRLYPVQVAEKGIAWLRMVARGPAGHGSMPRPDSAVARLSRAVDRLAQTELPVRLTPPAERYLRALAETQPMPGRAILRGLTVPQLVPGLIRLVPDPAARRALRAVLGNTVSPTVMRAGDKTNVIPGEASAELDGRLVEGQSAGDLIAELQQVLRREAGLRDVELSVLRESRALSIEPASPVWEAIVAALGAHDPGGVAIPYMIPGFTDAQAYSAQGTRVYGFAPVQLPADGPRFAELFHGDDERLPVEGLRWGVNVLYDVVQRLCVRQ